MGLHTPAGSTFHTFPPVSAASPATGRWSTFVRSYDWYLKAPERSRIMAETAAMAFAQYPDVKGSTLSAFGFSDYSGCSRSKPTPSTASGVMHAQRFLELRASTCARMPRSSRVRA